ncbi:MAG: thioesterase family protein [Desulfurococcaceae archaeon]
MDIALPSDLLCEQEYQVREEHIASHIGSGNVFVLSTPSMIAFMEKTALECIQKYLPEGYTTVGVMVNVKHLNPAPVGSKIRVLAQLVKQDGRKVLFNVKAYWNTVLIGEGEHERFIINIEKFYEKVQSLIPR